MEGLSNIFFILRIQAWWSALALKEIILLVASALPGKKVKTLLQHYSNIS
jgi:hypothetical protein